MEVAGVATGAPELIAERGQNEQRRALFNCGDDRTAGRHQLPLTIDVTTFV